MKKSPINWDDVEFKGDKNFLSNMYPCEIILNGISYASSENYYMSSKFVGTNDVLAEKLQQCTPQTSKRLANKHKLDIRPDWEDIKLQIMQTGLFAKFLQNTELATRLLATGNEHLEERNCWNDTFWGTCKGVGENNLGKLLMRVREYLKQKEIQ